MSLTGWTSDWRNSMRQWERNTMLQLVQHLPMKSRLRSWALSWEKVKSSMKLSSKTTKWLREIRSSSRDKFWTERNWTSKNVMLLTILNVRDSFCSGNSLLWREISRHTMKGCQRKKNKYQIMKIKSRKEMILLVIFRKKLLRFINQRKCMLKSQLWPTQNINNP